MFWRCVLVLLEVCACVSGGLLVPYWRCVLVFLEVYLCLIGGVCLCATCMCLKDLKKQSPPRTVRRYIVLYIWYL